VIEVYRDNELLEVLKPAQRFYTTQPDPLTEVDIRRTLVEDLYLVLVSRNESGSVTVRARINPLVVWAWFAFPLFSLGTVAAMLYRPRRLESPLVEKTMGLV
jgi:cytochrome c-type biogenesis protein CcmF